MAFSVGKVMNYCTRVDLAIKIYQLLRRLFQRIKNPHPSMKNTHLPLAQGNIALDIISTTLHPDMLRTEIDGDEVVLVEQFVEHLPVHLFDLILNLQHVLRGQPREHLLVIGHVT